MKKYIIKTLLTIFFLTIIINCKDISVSKLKKKSTQTIDYTIPKALFLTTGMNYGNGSLAEGCNIAIHSFSKHGIPMRLENRKILFDSTKLANYNFLIMSSASEYHDADRKHSLIYLSIAEMKIINKWVENGGVLIAGENIGRNYLSGVDRSSFSKGLLSSENWPLSSCFGVTLQERNMKGSKIEGVFGDTISRTLLVASKNHHWALVPYVVSKHLDVKAKWITEKSSYPAITENYYGKGKAILLPSSYLLHPANSGGLSGGLNIEKFYTTLINEYTQKLKHKIEINSWPGAYDFAFTIALDAEGSQSDFTSVTSLLDSFSIDPTFFVNAHLDSLVKKSILHYNSFVQSSGFNPSHSSKLDYRASQINILQNQQLWNKHFFGYHFPFFATSFQGLFNLEEEGYLYETSIGVDYLDSYKGSIFPYNIPISNIGYKNISSLTNVYKSLNLLELSPHNKKDIYFFAKFILDENYSKVELEKQSQIYSAYLLNYLKSVIVPNNALFVHFAHLSNTGFNNVTIRPLFNLLKTIESMPVWITTLDRVAAYWKNFENVSVKIKETENTSKILINSENKIKDFTLKLLEKPKKITIGYASYNLIERNDIFYLVFDIDKNQELVLNWR